MDTEGVWYLKRIKDGTHVRLLSKKLGDIPSTMLKASAEEYRKPFSNDIRTYLDNCKRNGRLPETKRIVNIFYNCLKEE